MGYQQSDLWFMSSKSLSAFSKGTCGCWFPPDARRKHALVVGMRCDVVGVVVGCVEVVVVVVVVVVVRSGLLSKRRTELQAALLVKQLFERGVYRIVLETVVQL